jgi:hypothetical protein
MPIFTATIGFSAASQLVVLAPLCVASALMAGRCGQRMNLALDMVSLVVSLAMTAVLFHAIDSAQGGETAGVMRYAYYLTAGPMLLALWAADGLLHRLAVINQARNRIAAAGSIASQTDPAPTPRVEEAFSQLSRG